MPSPWPALRAAYPANRASAVMRRAIAAEIRGGADLLRAQELANSAPLRPSPAELAPILDALASALNASAGEPIAKPIGQAVAFLRQAGSPHGAADPQAVPMAAVLARLHAARELAADAILARYSAD